MWHGVYGDSGISKTPKCLNGLTCIKFKNCVDVDSNRFCILNYVSFSMSKKNLLGTSFSFQTSSHKQDFNQVMGLFYQVSKLNKYIFGFWISQQYVHTVNFVSVIMSNQGNIYTGERPIIGESLKLFDSMYWSFSHQHTWEALNSSVELHTYLQFHPPSLNFICKQPASWHPTTSINYSITKNLTQLTLWGGSKV